MSWFGEDKRTWFQRFFAKILQSGPLPKHVAIIMDGNRRFARENNKKTIEGHVSGFEKLVEALTWCYSMNIREVTVYAFSIENFKRSKEEINGLFDLAREKFQRLLDEKDKINKLKVCIRMFGNITLLPADLQKLIAQVVEISRHNSNLFMNVCIAYTSRDEMAMAVNDICNGVKEEKLEFSDIDEKLIEKCLYTSNSYDIDLLLRTSGEVRLSDFMLWQSSFSVLSFVKEMWPELNIWNFYMAILNFQLNYDSIQKMKKEVEERNMVNLRSKYKHELLESFETVNKNSVEDLIDRHNRRVNLFLTELHNTRCRNFEKIAAAGD